MRREVLHERTVYILACPLQTRMPTRPIAELRSMVGESKRSVERLTVEAGKIEEFARALKTDNPAYRSPEAARAQGFERVPAPITFLRTALFPRYGPGETATGADRFPLGFDIGFDLRYRIHGGQEYEVERPLYVGDIINGTTTLVDVSQRAIDDGTLTLLMLETEYTDQNDDLVATERKTILEAPGGIEATPAEEGDEAEDPAVSVPDAATDAYRTTRYAEDVAVGDTGPEVVETFDLTDFVRYAGASNGLDRIHYDRDFVRDAGYPDVFAHGMLTAGVVEHMITDWLGLSRISRFGTRFTAPLWAGDTLTARGTVVDKQDRGDGAAVDVELDGVSQRGETVVEGEATAVLPSRDAS
jgi:peroxisomal enoyl-CoA hydratase 2